MTHPFPSDLINAYLDRVGRVPLLTADQEIVLGRQIQRGLQPDATAAEKRRGRRARDRMIRANLRLVVSVARLHTFKCKSSTFDDLVQLGNMGLIRAAEKFDPERGYKFSTYARTWIDSFINRGIIQTDGMIRIPDNAFYEIKKLKAAMKPGVTLAEAFEACGITGEKRDTFARMLSGISSLNTRTIEGDSELQDCIEQDYDQNEADRISAVHDILAELPYEEQQTVKMYYGIGCSGPAQNKEISKVTGDKLWKVRHRLKRAHNALASFPEVRQLCGQSSVA